MYKMDGKIAMLAILFQIKADTLCQKCQLTSKTLRMVTNKYFYALSPLVLFKLSLCACPFKNIQYLNTCLDLFRSKE